MAQVPYTFTKCTQHLANGQINWPTDTFKIILMQTTFSAAFNKDTMDSYNDVKAYELATANGYTVRGFPAIGSKTAASVAASHLTPLIGGPVSDTTGAGQTLTAYWAVLMKDSGVDTTSWLVAALDFGGAVAASNTGLFTITPDATLGYVNLLAV